MPSARESITRIQDVFESWRELGSKRLRDGTELIGRQTEGDEDCWMHAVFRRLEPWQISQVEALVGRRLPADLRRFYSSCGGMMLFGGLFRMFGLPRRRGLIVEHGVNVDDIVALNHELDHCTWQPEGAVAFATNEWDASVYLAGAGATDEQILRVARATGEERERIDDIWQLVADQLYRLDSMLIR